MARQRPRIDGDKGGIQHQIVTALRDAGCSVDILPGGNGRPDLLVGRVSGLQQTLNPYNYVPLRTNYLLEVKDGSKPPSRRKLNPDQEIWHAGWKGQVAKVETVEEALRVVGVE